MGCDISTSGRCPAIEPHTGGVAQAVAPAAWWSAMSACALTPGSLARWLTLRDFDAPSWALSGFEVWSGRVLPVSLETVSEPQSLRATG